MNEASPQLQDGFIQIANELFSALCCADFSKSAVIVLREALGQLFHRDAPKAAEISATDIARRTGIKKQYIARGVKELVDSGALIRVDERHYRFVKDYTKWTRNGDARLSSSEQIYARSWRRKHPKNHTKLVDSQTKLVDAAYQISCPDQPNQLTERTKLVDSDFSSPRPPIEERACVKKEENKEEIKEEAHANATVPIVRQPESVERYLEGKSAEDRKQFLAATKELKANPKTRRTGLDLEINANSQRVRALAPWQIYHASRVIQREDSPCHWDFFVGVAKKATKEEFKKTLDDLKPGESDLFVPYSKRAQVNYYQSWRKLGRKVTA